MSFPEWGFSYNALCVPLASDWQCSLIPSRDVQDVDRGWTNSYFEREKAREDRRKQIAQDRQDFDRLFRVSTNRRAARACSDFSTYVTFISEQLRLSGLSAPVDGDSVTRILRDAVRDGHLVPAIDREWRGGRRVTRFYAPQSWPKREPDPKPTVYGFHNGTYVPLDANGFIVDDTPYVPVRIAAKAAASASTVARSGGGSGSGFDWLGAAEAVAGAALCGAGSENDSGSDSMLKSFGDTDDAGSLFSDAQPFDYQPDSTNGDVFEIASQKTKTPNTGDPGTWYINPGSGQMRLYGDTGAPLIDLDYDHLHNGLRPHAHNWNGGVRDGGDDVVPFSPWNP
jgi:hypothetical protein